MKLNITFLDKGILTFILNNLAYNHIASKMAAVWYLNLHEHEVFTITDITLSRKPTDFGQNKKK